MERFVKGEVLVATFPFSDLTSKKRRPVLVLAQADLGDVIFCQITSASTSSSKYIEITDSSFSKGRLPIKSYVRPEKLFCGDKKLIVRRVGLLNDVEMKKVDRILMDLLKL